MKSSTKMIFIGVLTLICFILAAPQSWKSKLPDSFGSMKSFLLERKFHLGLDLQGGTQLDYLVDLRGVEKYNAGSEKKIDANQIVEGVRTTLERRVNGLGVSEPHIYSAEFGGEKHIMVELAGIDDINEAKKIVGKTIQLEFKEQKTEIDPGEKDKIKAEAEKTLATAKKSNDFALLGEKIKTGDNKINYTAQDLFQDELPKEVQDSVWKAKKGDIIGLSEITDGYTMTASQEFIAKTGYAMYQVGEKTLTERTKKVDGEDFTKVAKSLNASYEDTGVPLDYFPDTMRDPIESLSTGDISSVLELPNKYIIVKLMKKEEKEAEIEASHILISYAGAERSSSTKTKQEAKNVAEDILKRVKGGESFASLAGQYSDDAGSKTKGGDLGAFKKNIMTPAFETAAFSLKTGEISDIVETPFGFHIIKKTGEKESGKTLYTVQKIAVAKTDANAKAKADTFHKQVSPKEVTNKEEKIHVSRIFYSTLPDLWKSTGLDGSKFEQASVSFDQFGKPLVSIKFNEEGGKLFADLTERNIGKPIAIFVGGVEISAPRVNEKISGGSAQITGSYTIPEAAKLAQDLNTGAISAPIILVGQHQVGAMLGANALKSSLFAGLVGVIILGLYMVYQYGFLGFLADIALGLYALILFTILKSSNLIGMPIILTLAGIAGIILSIGMAVDANVLIFERIKEELKDGKKMTIAIALGFERAWLSIRDSNVSSLLTCLILAWFGSSIIRGFAINLAIGILVSMFTAITITRTFLYFFTTTEKK